MHGVQWDELSWRDRLDVTEAILCEPYSAEQALQNLENWIGEVFPTEESWGSTPAAQAGLAAAESAFGGPARKRDPAPTVGDDDPRLHVE